MRVDARDRFAATADLYERWRPTYPDALVDWLTAGLAPGSTVADLGCGTGIFSRLLAARGLHVIGIDPNETMLDKARAAGDGAGDIEPKSEPEASRRDAATVCGRASPRSQTTTGDVEYRRGEAAATGLSEGSVTLAVGAQSFHWFEVPATMRELRRILTTEGRGAAVWNVRADSPLGDAYEALLRRFSTEYGEVVRPEDRIAALRAFPGVTDIQEIELTHAQRLDRGGLFGRVYSSSYVVHGVDDREGFDRALDALFDAHQEGGVVELRYRCPAIAWRLGPVTS
jgi:SAM-dependent methyltransferase